MRVIFAALYVIGGILGAAVLLDSVGVAAGAPPIVVGLGLGLYMLLLCVVAVVLFNAKGTDPLGLKSPEEYLRHLDELGLLESSDFQARRAFAVAEFEDEGSHYFLELVDGRVLYLSGQYLYNYEPCDDPEMNQPRSFPCSDFTVARHKTERFVVEFACRGEVIEPEFVAPAFSKRDWRLGRVPQDGQIFSETTYDELKASMLPDVS